MEPAPPRETEATRHRREIAEALAALVTASLEKGESPPWRQPWRGGLGEHRSGRAGAGKPYQGWNAKATWVQALKHGYASTQWYTAEQGVRNGWTLKPDAVPARITYPSGQRHDWIQIAGGRFSRMDIFNRDSFEGPAPEPPPKPWDPGVGAARVIALIGAVGLDLETGGRACFYLVHDRIEMPAASRFAGASAWAGTAVHELIHWTGHPSRLARFGSSMGGTREYAFEELVAELGAAMVCAQLELPASRVDDDEHHAYLVFWAKAIREDPDALVMAIQKAEAAAAFLEDIAPEPFQRKRPVDSDGTLEDVPRRFALGDAWRGDVARHLRHATREPGRAPFVLGEPVAKALEGWAAEVIAWADGTQPTAPVLVLTGAPGDGAETVFAWLESWIAGERSQPLVGERRLALPVFPTLHPEPMRRAPMDPAHLPALALLRRWDHAVPGLPLLPADPSDGLELLGAMARSVPMAVVLRYVGAPAEVSGVFLADLAKHPLPGSLVARRLGKTDRRVWTAVGCRDEGALRKVESWASRLASSREWLDGHLHGTQNPLNRTPLRESAPFAPVVLHAAQAVLDCLARQRTPAMGLPALVELALAQAPRPWAAGTMIPLDALMAPAFHLDGPLERLEDRVRFVVRLLEMSPELSRGDNAVALMVRQSMDEPLGDLAARIRKACGNGFGRYDRVGPRGNVWECRDASPLWPVEPQPETVTEKAERFASWLRVAGDVDPTVLELLASHPDRALALFADVIVEMDGPVR